MLVKNAVDLPRFMQCNGSHFMPPSPSYQDDDPTARDEGNAAHWLAQVVFNGTYQLEELIDRKAENGVFITPEMADHVAMYLDALHPGGSMEIQTSFSDHRNWAVNARADHIAYNATTLTLYIDDFKYGYRIVNPLMNWTLIAHAIGWCQNNQNTPIAHIVFAIHQPRPHHRDGKRREWRISYEELIKLYYQLIEALIRPAQTLQTGPCCAKCPSAASCPAAQMAEYNAIDASCEAHSEDIGNDLLAFELDTINRAEAALKNRREALEQLAQYRIERGQVVHNYQVEIQLANRSWKQDVTAEMLLALTGKNLVKSSIGTPAQAERQGVPKEIVAMLTERRQTGKKLVRVNASEKANKLFNK